MFLNVRKERIHHCGHSNLDFRSNEGESVSKFVNAKNKLDFISANKYYFGSEDSSNFAKSPRSNKKTVLKLPFNDQRKIKKISEAIENSSNAEIEKAVEVNLKEKQKNFFKSGLLSFTLRIKCKF